MPLLTPDHNASAGSLAQFRGVLPIGAGKWILHEDLHEICSPAICSPALRWNLAKLAAGTAGAGSKTGMNHVNHIQQPSLRLFL